MACGISCEINGSEVIRNIIFNQNILYFRHTAELGSYSFISYMYHNQFLYISYLVLNLSALFTIPIEQMSNKIQGIYMACRKSLLYTFIAKFSKNYTKHFLLLGLTWTQGKCQGCGER